MEPTALPGATPSCDARPEHRWGHGVFRHLFVPAVLALSAASWAFHEQGARFLKASSIPLDFTSAVLLLSIVLLWCAEQAYPANPDWNYRLLAEGERGWSGWQRLGRDLLYLFVITQVTTLLVFLTSIQVESGLKSRGFGFGISHSLWPDALPFPVRVLLVFLLMELSSYWLHRAAHRFGFLWRFHSTHHAVTELTALKALRTHPLDNVLFYLARYVPLLLLGAGSEEVVTVVYFGAILSLLAHSNIDVAEGVLGLVVNLPHYHSVHHAADLAASQSNFGCHTILWDRLFGTFQRPAEGARPLGMQPVGPRTLWQELIAPLYRAP
ncbi:sterol desaturase family protein [Vitiosangium sp. GDMCC 1.1324]|uniref:sterol desaturase family protein n=1 Tax=Vitiosangium sp. (strain GDMCC 1.1324) TaxID=2138576 RepID=UPI00130DF86E|nr:sterol desaturase family protein [Vitiosangium sp. GDMCC 1.1324]